MNSGVKKVKDYLETKSQRFGGNKEWALHCCTGTELFQEEDLRQEMCFETPEDLDFGLMNFFFGGRLSRLCELGYDLAMNWNWGGAYDSLKWIVTDLVGWDSIYTSEDKHPALHSQEAYSLVLENLALACQQGEDEGRKRRSEE